MSKRLVSDSSANRPQTTFKYNFICTLAASTNVAYYTSWDNDKRADMGETPACTTHGVNHINTFDVTPNVTPRQHKRTGIVIMKSTDSHDVAKECVKIVEKNKKKRNL